MRNRLTVLAAAGCALLLAVPLCAAGASTANTAKKTAERSAWPAETLSGTITIVDPGLKTVVVKSSDGVPFDIVVNGKTKIEAGNQKITLQDLQQQDVNKTVSVRFVPERQGDVASTIQLNG